MSTTESDKGRLHAPQRHRVARVTSALTARIVTSCKRIAGWPKVIGVYLIIGLLKQLQRTTNSNWFRRILLGPVGRAMAVSVLAWFCWKLFRAPDALSGHVPPDLAQQIADFKAHMDGKVNRDTTDSSRALSQTMTWGVGGVAIALLTGILATHMTSLGSLIGAGCFALAIPLLAICGVVQANHNNPKNEPPSLREALHLFTLTAMGQLAVCLGVTALLWSYNQWISVIFLLGCYLRSPE